MRLKPMALLAVSFTLTGCYHVTVTSGAPASPSVVDRPFQHSFVFGLVPPAELNVRDDCPGGVSKIETRHSFVNGLVAVLTSSIYTPIHVRVTCASR